MVCQLFVGKMSPVFVEKMSNRYLLPHLGWIAARAHGPTKEKYADIGFSVLPAHAKNGPRWVQMGSGGFLFLLIQTLPTFWAERILILRIFIFGILGDSNFPDFQVPRFPDFQISGK